MKTQTKRTNHVLKAHRGKIAAAVLAIIALFIAAPFAADHIGDQTAGSITHVDRQEAVQDEITKFLDELPEWDGTAFAYVNDNNPEFEPVEIHDSASEWLDPLDEYGRCGSVIACIGIEGMPTGERGSISEVKPTGWHTDQYGFIDGGNLYNRCHLIGWQLSGDDAVPRNLITGTRYMNTDGMLPFENAIAGYVRGTKNHVMYRVTPVFAGKEMVARGVQLEAYSVEDSGQGVCFNVFCYNIQPGVDIDYLTGDNHESADTAALEKYQKISAAKLQETPDTHALAAGERAVPQDSEEKPADAEPTTAPTTAEPTTEPTTAEPTTEAASAYEYTYILNTNTRVFHYPDCGSVSRMKDKNKQEVTGTRDEIISSGYKPCGNCHP